MINRGPVIQWLDVEFAGCRAAAPLLDDARTSLVMLAAMYLAHHLAPFLTTKKEPSALSKFLKYSFLAGPEGVEPSTDGFGDQCSTS